MDYNNTNYNINYNTNYNTNNNQNIDIYNEYISEKIIINTKNYYCSNCNKRGHMYKKCKEPIISNGIICFNIDGFNNEFLPLLEDYIISNLNKKTKKVNKNTNTIDNGSNINSTDNRPNNIFSSRIKFLMVQRKHSLGYLEFIRGRYDNNNIQSYKYLLEQMTPIELSDINTKEFDYLWNMLWDNNPIPIATISKNKFHYKEYILSRQKFYELKLKSNNILTSTKTFYNENEWGFPKGRRELYESDLVCAMREFEEETNYNEKDYLLISESNLIVENLVGTNGINYKHNYFLAFTPNAKINVDNTNKEIGDINYMDLNKCLSIIRPYHHSKIFIIKKINDLIINFLLEYSNKIENLFI